MQLDSLGALRVHIVDEELIDNASIDHELQSFIFLLDFFDQVLRVTLDLGPLGLTLRYLLLECLALSLEGHNLVFKGDGLTEFVLHASNLGFQGAKELFVFEALSIETPRRMIMLFLLLLQSPLKIRDR